jgi:hypothetical protein
MYEASSGGVVRMRPAGLLWRLQLAARGWFWLSCGQMKRAPAVLREMLALEVPAAVPPKLREAREKLIGDLAEAALLRLRRSLGRGPEAERAWREIGERLLEEGWARERLGMFLDVGKGSG